jgi:uncharacterized protein (AIM24 family)
MFTTVFMNGGRQKRKVAFGAAYPGKIIPMDLAQLGGTLLCQKDAFLCAAKGVALGIAFQKRLGAGFFGGEGFVLQKLEGDGLAFIHAGGAIIERPYNQARPCASIVAAWSPLRKTSISIFSLLAA